MLELWELGGQDDCRFSTYSWRTRLALHHKGLTFTFEVRKKLFQGPGESLYGSELLRSGAAEIEQIFAFELGEHLASRFIGAEEQFHKWS